MVQKFPSFLRRHLRMFEARRALVAGEPEDALRHLSDPALQLDEGAARLRARVLDALCKQAARMRSEGGERSALRLLALVGAEDPGRAESWRRKLGMDVESGVAHALVAERPNEGSGILAAIEGVLAEMRRERLARTAAEDAAAAHSAPEARTSDGESEARPPALRFHLAVDDAGEHLVASGVSVVVGHARNAAAELPFLADVDGRHAILGASESFHEGPGWRIAPAGGQRIAVDGRSVDAGGARLCDGDLVRLAQNLAFTFRSPDPGCASALLELAHGAECLGAARVLLLAAGPAGAIRIGGRARCQVRVPGLREEVRLALEAGALAVECESGLIVASTEVAGERRAPATAARIALPPLARVHVTLASSPGGRPPFGLSIRPLEAPRAQGAGP